MPSTYQLAQPNLVWPESYWRESESAWLSVHKLGFLNGLGGAALKEALVRPQRDAQGCASGTHSLFLSIAKARMKGTRPPAREDVLRAFTLEELFAAHTEHVVVPHLRYCPECLRRWFHASIFQLGGISTCPIHKCALVSGCPQCANPIPVAFDTARFRLPLHCVGCGSPFAGRTPIFSDIFGCAPRDAYEPALLFTSLQLELVTLCEACRVDVPRWQTACPYPHGTYLRSLIAGQLGSSALRSALAGSGPQIVVHRCADEDQVANAVTTPEARAQVKAMGRHFARRVRLRCRHRVSPSLRFEVEKVGGIAEGWNCWLSPSERHPGPGPGPCACCFVLARWRMLFAELFMPMAYIQAIYQHDESAGHAGSLKVPTPEAAYDLFSICAVQVAYALGVFGWLPYPSDLVRDDERDEYRRLWPPLNSHLLNKGTARYSIGYVSTDIDHILDSLANIQLVSAQDRFVSNEDSLQGAIWGQSVARTLFGRRWASWLKAR